jgi:acyl carrier protein
VTDVESRIRSFVEQSFGRGGTPIEADTSLLDSGLVDSTGIFELVSFLEGEFGIEVADEEIVPEHFESPRLIAAFVDGKRQR